MTTGLLSPRLTPTVTAFDLAQFPANTELSVRTLKNNIRLILREPESARATVLNLDNSIKALLGNSSVITVLGPARYERQEACEGFDGRFAGQIVIGRQLLVWTAGGFRLLGVVQEVTFN